LGFVDTPMTKVRAHQEWVGDVTRTSLSIPLIAAIGDPFISLRNRNYNTSAESMITEVNCNGIIPSALAKTVIKLLHTRTYGWGSTVVDESELALALYRGNEVGLPSYINIIPYLTDNPTVSDLGGNVHPFFGAQTETNPARRYKNTAASLAIASVIHINDVTIVDHMSYYHTDSSGIWTGKQFHPDSRFFTLPSSSWGSCYVSDGDCTDTAKNAAAILLGYHTAMDSLEVPEFTRSRGALFPEPALGYSLVPPAQFNNQFDNHTDYQTRTYYQWQTLPEFLNPLFYQYDGLASLAYFQAGSESSYLPNQLAESVPTNIGWASYFDGFCFDTNYFLPTCSRHDTNRDNGLCVWSWFGPPFES
jgi:hypothetical protein